MTLDPHKWLYQPYECGCVFVRHGDHLRSAFEIVPDYLRAAEAGEVEVNFSALGLQLSRSARAFKLWFSLRYFGIDAFAEAIDRSLDLAGHAAAAIDASPVLEHCAPPSLGIVCFRRTFADTDDEVEIERRNAALAAAGEASGVGLVSSTRLHGRYALRLCVMNHTTGREHVDAVLDLIAHGNVDDAARPAPSPERHPSVPNPVPLLAALPPGARDAIFAQAERRDVRAGTSIVERWEASREFYVLLAGSVSVRVGDEVVNTLGAGEFFGELAALDWGAGYGYPRLATIVADTDVHLLVFPDGALPALVRRFPAIETRIRETARARLARR